MFASLDGKGQSGYLNSDLIDSSHCSQPPWGYTEERGPSLKKADSCKEQYASMNSYSAHSVHEYSRDRKWAD